MNDRTPQDEPTAVLEPERIARPQGVVNISGEEVRDLAVAFMNAASEKVSPERPGGALLVVTAALRAAATISVANGFPRVPLFRMLANEIELAERIQTANALAESQAAAEAS